jgi:pimeloyl-ACP methyl ester carboxylesterase
VSAAGLSPRRRPVVVLLHSSASSARQWDALVPMLEPRFEVHAVDLLGHGKQPAGAAPASVHDEAALVQPLLERAGAVHLVGHSYGGAVAMHLAAAQPARVLSLAVYEPVLFSLLSEHEPAGEAALEVFNLARTMRERVAAGDLAAAAAGFLDSWSGPGAWASMSPARQETIATRAPFVSQHFEALYREPMQAPKLSMLLMPLLCLSGGRSTPAAQRIVALLKTLLPHARHERVPEAGHMGPVTHAEQVNPRLGAFLHAQLGQAASGFGRGFAATPLRP